MKKIKFSGTVGLLILTGIILLQNTESVETKLLFLTITMPRALLLLTTAAFGFIKGTKKSSV